MRILVVEDEHRIANSIKKGLEQEKYAVDVAYTGEDGYDLASSESYDALILDLMLPKLDGYSMHKQLQADEKTANIPTIVLTAKGGMQDMFQFEKNIVAYIEKPFDPKILREKVKEVLNV